MKDNVELIVGISRFDDEVCSMALTLSKKEIENYKGNPKELLSNKLHDMVSKLLDEAKLFNEDDE